MMVKLINYSLTAALPVATSADLHIHNQLFTRSLHSAKSIRWILFLINL